MTDKILTPLTTSHLVRIRHRIDSLYFLAENHLQRTFPRPALKMNLKGETAGQAWPEKNLIRLNATLYLENQAHYLKQTVGHEVAHLIAYQYYGVSIRPHGKEWEGVMTDIFQLPAERCHSYDTGRSTHRPYLYRCHCTGKQTALSQIRHNRATKGTVYLCTTCHQPLAFESQYASKTTQ